MFVSAERYAFIYDSVPLEYVNNMDPCLTTLVGRVFNKFGYGLALPKYSPFTEMFSMQVLRLRQSGFMEQLYKKWFGGTCPVVEGKYKDNIKVYHSIYLISI